MSPLLKSRIAQITLASLTAAGIIFGIYSRIHKLGYPDGIMREEDFFYNAANGYLHHAWVYQDHPPLGILFITVAMRIWGATPLGGRIAPLLFGLVLIVLMGWLAWELFKSRVAVLVALLMAALDGYFVYYSRGILTDGIMMTFILAGYLALLKAKTPKHFIWIVGTLLGLAASVKWIGFFGLGPILYFLYKQKRLKLFPIILLWALLLYTAILVFSKAYTHLPFPLLDAWHWQVFAMQFHETRQVGLGNPWYSWPVANGSFGIFHYVNSMVAIGQIMPNPIITWLTTAGAGSVMVLYTWASIKGAGKRFKGLSQRYEALIIAFVSFYLPWIYYVKRTEFIYHYWPSYSFAILIFAGLMASLWKYQKWTVIALCTVILWSGWYFMPIWIGQPITREQYVNRMWLNSWRSVDILR
jgi:dolichyl-phosphate-mannose-protein mannosyltransferase